MPSPLPSSNASSHAFDAISSHLNDPTSTSTLEIEILPSALCPPGPPTVIRDGNCIGVPKKLLALAYTHAVHKLFEDGRTVEPSLEALHASSIVLLMSPEHLTACNLRKRHLLSLPPSSLPDALNHELRFLNSLLTSPLHRHTKSPTLWSHRRWLLSKYLPLTYSSLGKENDDEEASSSVILPSELHIILRAATHHPRNYYAFQHLRLLILEILPSHFPSFTSSQFAHQAVLPVQSYCRKHHSDTSAWSAASFLLGTADDPDLMKEVVRETIELVEKWRWKGEAVRVFLRGFGVENGAMDVDVEKLVGKGVKRSVQWEEGGGLGL